MLNSIKNIANSIVYKHQYKSSHKKEQQGSAHNVQILKTLYDKRYSQGKMKHSTLQYIITSQNKINCVKRRNVHKKNE